MSQYKFAARLGASDEVLEIVVGFDEPLGHCFAFATRDNDEMAFSSLDEPSALHWAPHDVWNYLVGKGVDMARPIPERSYASVERDYRAAVDRKD